MKGVNLRSIALCLLALSFYSQARSTGDLPHEWDDWLAFVSDLREPLNRDLVMENPEARKFEVWLATASPFRIKRFESALEKSFFLSDRKQLTDGETLNRRLQMARALFSLPTSVRLENLAKRYLFESPIAGERLPKDIFNSHLFLNHFFYFKHWRESSLWYSALTDLILQPPAILGHDSTFKSIVAQNESERIDRWRIVILREEWMDADVSLIVPLLELLVTQGISDELEDFLLQEVLNRPDIIRQYEWKDWLWARLEKRFPYLHVSPYMLERAKLILSLLNTPGAENHVSIIERVVRAGKAELDVFIDEKILEGRSFRGHPLLIKVADAPTPTSAHLRRAFSSGESTYLWSHSIGRFCQARLRRVIIQKGRQLMNHLMRDTSPAH